MGELDERGGWALEEMYDHAEALKAAVITLTLRWIKGRTWQSSSRPCGCLLREPYELIMALIAQDDGLGQINESTLLN
jgi:hypothetical protein